MKDRIRRCAGLALGMYLVSHSFSVPACDVQDRDRISVAAFSEAFIRVMNNGFNR